MSYENEHGAAGRLAAGDEYGTPSDGYVAQQSEAAGAPDGRGEQSEPEPDRRDVPAADVQASGDSGSDAVPHEYWPGAGGVVAGPGNWASADALPGDAPVDYWTPNVGQVRPGGLHAPLPATETEYVDWIKGLGAADAAQEQWASATDPILDDTDEAAAPEDRPKVDPTAEDEPAEDEMLTGSPDAWPPAGAPSGQLPEHDAPSEERLPVMQPAQNQSRSDDEENWFEPKQPPGIAGPVHLPLEHLSEHDAPSEERLPVMQPAQNQSRSDDEENWFEPKQPPGIAGPVYLPVGHLPEHDAPAGLSAPVFQSAQQDHRLLDAQEDGSEPEQRPGRLDWPRSAIPMDSAPLLGAPPRYAWEADRPRPAAELEYVAQDHAAADYGTAGHEVPDEVWPVDAPATHASRDDETTRLLPGSRLLPGRWDGISERRRKLQSYRKYAIVAAVFVVAMIGLVGLALRGGPAQSASPTGSHGTVDPARAQPDGSPSASASSGESTGVSPSPSGPTSVSGAPPVVRTPAKANPTAKHSSVPPPPGNPPPHPSSSPSPSPSPSPSGSSTSAP
jgi:hypothetical protein